MMIFLLYIFVICIINIILILPKLQLPLHPLPPNNPLIKPHSLLKSKLHILNTLPIQIMHIFHINMQFFPNININHLII